MPTSYTSLLGLALPTTGELSGTWGTTVNDAITSLLDSAVAGTTTLSTDADVTLTTTDGAANQARSAVLLCSGARTAIRTLTAPAKSKGYVIVNATTGGYDVKIVGVGPTTGVSVPAGTRVFVVWNGSDFVKVASSSIAAATDITGVLPTANGGTNLSSFTANGAVYATSTSALTTGTLPVASGGTGATALTANNVILGNGTSAVQFVAPGTNGNVLTSNGTTWASSAAVAGIPNITYAAKTGAYTLVAADKGYWIDCTSNTFTLSFTAAATLGSGWWCLIRNSGTGNITLDPNASETIDGLTSYIMYPNEARLVQCDGTAFRSQIMNPYYATFTSSGTYTKPPGYKAHSGLLWGGGGGGATGSGSVGGGGGSCAWFILPDASIGASETVTIGGGGTGSSLTTPSAGTASTLGSLVRANGAQATTSLNGGTAYFAANVAFGGTGSAMLTGGNSGPTLFGGGSGDQTPGGYPTVYGGSGGAKQGSTPLATTFGGAGGTAGTTGVGGNGTAPGGGGGATNSGANGGDGARGELRMWGIV